MFSLCRAGIGIGIAPRRMPSCSAFRIGRRKKHYRFGEKNDHAYSVPTERSLRSTGSIRGRIKGWRLPGDYLVYLDEAGINSRDSMPLVYGPIIDSRLNAITPTLVPRRPEGQADMHFREWRPGAARPFR